MNSMKTQRRGTGELKSCSVGKSRPSKKKGRLHILLIALPLQFWFHPSSLQFAGLQSGVWHCRSPQASFLALRYETRKREKSHTSDTPAAKTAKPPSKNSSSSPSFQNTPHSAHTRPTLDPPHREEALGATCGKDHFRGRASGGERIHHGKAVGSSQPRGDMHFPELQLHCFLSPTM